MFLPLAQRSSPSTLSLSRIRARARGSSARGCESTPDCGNLAERTGPSHPPGIPPVTTVDIETLLAQDELRSLLETCEQTGSIRAPDVTEIVETHELSGLEHEALVRELDKRGIEIVEAAARRAAAGRAGARSRRRRTRSSSSCARPAATGC